jgi:hypothetical protein
MIEDETPEELAARRSRARANPPRVIWSDGTAKMERFSANSGGSLYVLTYFIPGNPVPQVAVAPPDVALTMAQAVIEDSLNGLR